MTKQCKNEPRIAVTIYEPTHENRGCGSINLRVHRDIEKVYPISTDEQSNTKLIDEFAKDLKTVLSGNRISTLY
jgi:hypothetical protein